MSKQHNGVDLRGKILAAVDRKPEPIPIPEWDVELFVQPLDGESRYRLSRLAASASEKGDNVYIVEAYVCEGLVDEHGNRVFELEDRKLLAGKNPEVVGRIYDKVIDVSGMHLQDEVDAAKK